MTNQFISSINETAGVAQCLSLQGEVQWSAPRPTMRDWQRLSPSAKYTEEQLLNGRFGWINGFEMGEVYIVFRPYAGLDFNLVYAIDSGKLLRISEAR